MPDLPLPQARSEWQAPQRLSRAACRSLLLSDEIEWAGDRWRPTSSGRGAGLRERDPRDEPRGQRDREPRTRAPIDRDTRGRG